MRMLSSVQNAEHRQDKGETMKNNRGVITLICGGIIIGVTIIFYLLTFDHIFTLPMRWLSLLFLLVVEVMGTVKVLKFGESILGAAHITLSAIHLAVVLILSILFVNIGPVFIKQYILINLLMIAIVAIIDVWLLYFDTRAKKSNQDYMDSSLSIKKSLHKAQEIMVKYENSEYASELNRLMEGLEYSNRSRLNGTEDEILSGLEELMTLLESSEEAIIKQKINEVQNLIELRSRQMKKSGSF